jgi:hypothetical protein
MQVGQKMYSQEDAASGWAESQETQSDAASEDDVQDGEVEK